MFISYAFFLITQPFLNIYRHAIHQIRAEYHSYPIVSVILYNSSQNNCTQFYHLQNFLLEQSMSQNFELGPSFYFICKIMCNNCMKMNVAG